MLKILPGSHGGSNTILLNKNFTYDRTSREITGGSGGGGGTFGFTPAAFSANLVDPLAPMTAVLRAGLVRQRTGTTRTEILITRGDGSGTAGNNRVETEDTLDVLNLPADTPVDGTDINGDGVVIRFINPTTSAVIATRTVRSFPQTTEGQLIEFEGSRFDTLAGITNSRIQVQTADAATNSDLGRWALVTGTADLDPGQARVAGANITFNPVTTDGIDRGAVLLRLVSGDIVRFE